MCNGRRQARRAFGEQQMMLQQSGGMPAHFGGPFSGRSYGRRRGNGPISELIALAKPLLQEQMEKRNQPRNVNFESSVQPQMQRQSSGTVPVQSIPRAPIQQERYVDEPEYKDEKGPTTTFNPRLSELPPSYDHAVQVQRAVLPQTDNVEVFAELERQERFPSERMISQRSAERPVETRTLQSQLSGRLAERFQREQERAEAKLLRKAEKYAKKDEKLARKARRHLDSY